ncbi:hypothetical protein [Micromonospora sp. CV4]|uniref:hypothetical protein n=1 Tax=Micromonospora sp. CV4 TaxID=2478711 RepID=UPI000EF4E84E|nr:hypothetical protein [Micromonospora sp. CV4]RLP98323.1 hypothetical protein EAD98_04870 [Micromonospora sp. CV4]
MYRTISRLGAVLALALSIVAGAGTAAQAGAPDPYSPPALCGFGYVEVDQDPIRDAQTGGRLGTVHLLYNRVTGFACTATVKSAYPGTLTRTRVYLVAEYVPTQVDDGARLYAAGPVRAYVRGSCTIWGGLMADPGGAVHHHERANPAIGGIGTCF